MAVSANRLELLQIADAVAREKSSTGRSFSPRWRTPSPRRPARATAPRPRSMPTSTPRPASCACRATCTWSTRSTTRPSRSRCRTRSAPIRPPRWATPSPTRCRRFDFGRIAAQSAKQVIVQKVREAERDRQYEEFKDRIGDIVNGIVKRAEYGNVIVDLGPRRSHRPPRRDDAARGVPPRRPHPRLCFRRAPRDSAARRFSCRARIRSSWPSCSRRKCRRSMTASSR